MAAILAFASVGALFTQPILAIENGSMIENILDSAIPTDNNNNNNNNIIANLFFAPHPAMYWILKFQ